MQSLYGMPIDQAIELYYEKHHALRHGDMTKLIALKRQYPAIFNKKMDSEILGIIQYAKEFQKTKRYQELCKQELADPEESE